MVKGGRAVPGAVSEAAGVPCGPARRQGDRAGGNDIALPSLGVPALVVRARFLHL